MSIEIIPDPRSEKFWEPLPRWFRDLSADSSTGQRPQAQDNYKKHTWSKWETQEFGILMDVDGCWWMLCTHVYNPLLSHLGPIFAMSHGFLFIEAATGTWLLSTRRICFSAWLVHWATKIKNIIGNHFFQFRLVMVCCGYIVWYPQFHGIIIICIIYIIFPSRISGQAMFFISAGYPEV